MKLVPWLVLLFLCISCTSISSKRNPRVVQGQLDLSEWKLDSDGPVELFGDVEFYWSELLEPKDFQAGSRPKRSSYQFVPSAWNGVTVGKTELGSYGYATYRLRVKLNKENVQPLGILFSNEIGAFRVYVNGNLLIEAGVPGKTESITIPDYSARTANFTPETDTLEVVIQASNFHAFFGGLLCNIHLGTSQGILKKRIKGFAMDLFLVGSVFIMGCYHLCLFLLRRTHKSALFFSAFCFVSLAYSLVVGEKFLFYVFPHIPWNASFKIVYFITYCIMIVVLTFCHFLFEEESSRKTVKTLQVIYLLLIAIELCTDAKVYTFVLLFYYVVVLVGFVYILYLGVRARLSRRPGASIFIAGFSFIILSAINDMLYTQKVINTGDYMPLALVCFFFSQAYLLAYRFTKSMEAEERLTGELSALTSNLEQRVQKRTLELKGAYEEMKVTNEELTNARNHLWGEMQLARKIQTVLLPKKPVIPGYEIAAYMETADEVGGDYYDVINADGKNWLVIGDVSGHGVPAGLIMMMAQTAIHTVLKERPHARP